MQYRLVNARVDNSNYASTSCKHFVNIVPVISEFKRLQCGLFAAIRPQFNDHDSFGTLSFRNGLEHRYFDFSRLINNYSFTTCKRLVIFGLVGPEFKM